MDNEDIKGNISINEYITGYNHQYIYIYVCVCLNTEFTPNCHFDREGDDDKPFGFWGTLFSNKPVWVWGGLNFEALFWEGSRYQMYQSGPTKGVLF